MVELHSVVRWAVITTGVAAMGGLFAVRASGRWMPVTTWLAHAGVARARKAADVARGTGLGLVFLVLSLVLVVLAVPRGAWPL